MTKILMIAALTMVSASAFASKARLTALQGAAHLTDVQNSFEQPWQVGTNGELATVEFGSSTGTPNAEGGFVRQMGEGYLGVYLGHMPTSMISSIDALNLTNGTTQISALSAFGLNNPFNVWYAAKSGDMTWGVNFYYLSSNVKAGTNTLTTGAAGTAFTDQKANVMGVSLGATNGVWDASLVLGLAGKGNFKTADGTTDIGTGTPVSIPTATEVELTSKSNVKVLGGYTSGTMYYWGRYNMSGGKAAVGGTDAADMETTNMAIGVINSHKKEGTEFFYGISYAMDNTKEKIGDTKTESTALPIIVGVEADANSWLVLRGSLTQNFPLLGSTKSNGGDANTLAHNTKVAAGAGVKLNKFTMDATLETANDGKFGFDENGFMANTSLTYAF